MLKPKHIDPLAKGAFVLLACIDGMINHGYLEGDALALARRQRQIAVEQIAEAFDMPAAALDAALRKET